MFKLFGMLSFFGFFLFGCGSGDSSSSSSPGQSLASKCREMCQCSFDANYKMASSVSECASFCVELGGGGPIHPSCQ